MGFGYLLKKIMQALKLSASGMQIRKSGLMNMLWWPFDPSQSFDYGNYASCCFGIKSTLRSGLKIQSTPLSNVGYLYPCLYEWTAGKIKQISHQEVRSSPMARCQGANRYVIVFLSFCSFWLLSKLLKDWEVSCSSLCPHWKSLNSAQCLFTWFSCVSYANQTRFQLSKKTQ